MKSLITIAMMMISTQIATEMSTPRIALDKKEIAITNQIIKNKPNVDKAFAKKLSTLIHKYATIYKADAGRAVAVAMAESGYRSVVNKNTNKTKDLGVFQINTKTIKEYKFDAKRLVSDDEYSVQAYFKVMGDKVRQCSKLKSESWTCYHSKNIAQRKTYKKLVNRFYAVN